MHFSLHYPYLQDRSLLVAPSSTFMVDLGADLVVPLSPSSCDVAEPFLSVAALAWTLGVHL